MKIVIIIPPALETGSFPAEIMIRGVILNRLNDGIECDIFDLNFKYRYKEDSISDRFRQLLSLFLNANKLAEPIILKYLQNFKQQFITNLVQKLIGNIDFSNYDMVVIATLEKGHIKLGLCFAKFIKEASKKKIVFGNISDAQCYDPCRLSHLIENFDFIDYLIENTRGYDMSLNLLNHYPDKLEQVVGLIYKKGDKLIYNKSYQRKNKNSFFYDLDQMQPPLNIDDKIMKACRSVAYEVGRGCKNECFFCNINQYPYIMKSPKKVVEDIKRLIDRYRISNFGLSCSSINGDKSWLLQFLNEIEKEKLHFFWLTMAIPKNLDISTLRRMADCGCVKLHFGFESRSFKRLSTISKDINLQETEAIIINCNKVGICVRPLFIVGFPHETKEEISKIEKFIRSNYKRFASIEIQTFKLKPYSCLCYNKREMANMGIVPRKPDLFGFNYIPYDENGGKCWEEKINDNFEKKDYLIRLCNDLGIYRDSMKGLIAYKGLFF